MNRPTQHSKDRSDTRSPPGRTYWLDRPANVNKVVYLLYAICLLLAAGDLLYEKHPHFAFEEWFGFFAFFGLVACVALVLSAKALRTFLMRDEAYYDENPDEPEGGHGDA